MNEPNATVPKWLAWLRLARVSAMPSAVSNILMGFLLINASWQPWPSLLLLLISSACLYSAGMILNDYFDRDVDQESSPGRPIPSGQIPASTALTAGIVLCGIGIGSATIAGALASGFAKPLTVSVLLTVAILLYDWVLKKTAVAPLFMGLCRFLNVLLGASVFGDEIIIHEAAKFMGFDALIFWVAGSVGIFVTGLTIFARDERQGSLRWKLAAGLLVMILGIAGLALTPEQVEPLQQINQQRFSGLFGLLVLLVAVTVIRSATVAVWTAKPAQIQAAIITSLRSLIIFDACIVFLFRLGEPAYPLTVISLLGVSLLLGRRIRST